MTQIILDTLAMALLGGIFGGGIRFGQWLLSELTLEILVSPPTSDTVVSMILKMTVLGAFVGFVNGVFTAIKDRKKRKIWVQNSNTGIYYKVMPPHFRSVPQEELFECCGYCKYYENGKGCKKYGVTYEGVSCIVMTVCDDYEFSMHDD